MSKRSFRYFRQSIFLFLIIILVYFIYIRPGYSITPLVLFYNGFSFFILIGSVVIFHFALEDEWKLRYINVFKKNPSTVRQWSDLWKVYESTFLKGHKSTTEPSENYFNPDNLLAASLDRIPMLAILRALPGTYTGLGILGTFMGFAAGLSNFDPSTTQSMQASITTLLTGINTAFNTSIIGVVLSITFNFFFLQPLLKRLERECQILADRLDAEHYIDSVDHLKEILAFEEDGQTWLPRDYSREMLSQQKSQTRSLANFTTDLSDSMSNLASALVENYRQQMQEMISTDLKPVLSSLAESAQRLLEEKMETADQALEGVVDRLNGALTQFLIELKENISGQTKQEMEGLTSNIKLAGESLTKFPALMEDLKQDVGFLLSRNEEAMNKITIDSVILLSEAMQDLRNLSDESKSMMDSFNLTLKASESQNRHAESILKSFAAVSETAASTAQELRQSFHEYREHGQEMLKSIIEQVSGLRSVTEAVASAANGFAGLDESMSSSFQTIIEGMDQYRESVKAGLEEYLEKYSTSMSGFAGRLSSAVEELSEVVGELQETIGTVKRSV